MISWTIQKEFVAMIWGAKHGIGVLVQAQLPRISYATAG